jgi:hypothetical protein
MSGFSVEVNSTKQADLPKLDAGGDCRPNLINILGHSLGAISTTMAPKQVHF